MLVESGVTRYDYVRVVCRVAPGYGGVWKAEMLATVPKQYRDGDGIDKRHGKITNMWDGKSKRPTMFIEFWGIAADHFMAGLNPSYYPTITRLDVRAEIPTLPLDYFDFFKEVKQRKGNARRTTKYIESPKRTKEDGRDAGGESVIVGAQGSRRRLCVYIRGKANAALEVQFSDGEPARFAQIVADAVMREDCNQSAYEIMRSVATQQYYDAVADMSGHTYGEFAHLDWWHSQTDLLEGQEVLLAKADEVWNRLDPEAQQAFIRANISPDGRYGVPVQEPTAEGATYSEPYDVDDVLGAYSRSMRSYNAPDSDDMPNGPEEW